ncbi:MAG: UDP-N-acetylmuramoyl-L-alanine--D-glutamate ligase [Armatimonadota bacterium]
MNLEGARIAVIGAAATGISTARVLSRRGARVVVLDRTPEAQVGAARASDWNDAATRYGIDLRWGTEELPADVDWLVPSPGVRRTAAPVRSALDRGIPVVSEIEIGGAIARAPVLAVTGTNGKTTTVAWLADMVAASGRAVRACGNLAADGGERLPLIEAADAAGPAEILVAEVSSFQLEWTRSFAPRGAAWLNLSADHLDAYPSMDAYAADKARLLRNQTEQQVAVLNRSDPWVVSRTAGVGNARRVWFDADAPVFPESLRDASEGILLPGRHNRANALAAALLALDMGVPAQAVGRALAQFRGVPHRMELVLVRGGVTWINNSMCTNAAAVAASLEAVSGPVIAIAGGRLKESDPTDLCEALARHARQVILIGEAAPSLAATINAISAVPTFVAPSMEEAVRQAESAAVRGETVVLAPGCSSFDMYSGFEARGQDFRRCVHGLARQ